MLYLATDHAGFKLMQEIIKYLNEQKVLFNNIGALTYQKDDNYVVYTLKANKKVAEDKNNFGIYICGTGIGTSIAANRDKNIRAALCCNAEFARLSRLHNNANVLVLPGRFLNIEQSKKIIKAFLTTKFEGGRHMMRVEMLS